MLVLKDGVLNCVFLRVFTNLSLFFHIIIAVFEMLRGAFDGRRMQERRVRALPGVGVFEGQKEVGGEGEVEEA